MKKRSKEHFQSLVTEAIYNFLEIDENNFNEKKEEDVKFEISLTDIEEIGKKITNKIEIAINAKK